MKNFGTVVMTVLLVVIIIIGAAFILPNGCTDPDGTRHLLSAQGYTQIEITGYRYFMAGDNDIYCTGFKAKSPAGVWVTGAVTKGAFKGATIRFD